MGVSFNTSHVTLYHIPLKDELDYSSRFNTSHVTLYPYQLQLHAALVAVSIHLMLLFIFCDSTQLFP